VGSDEVSVVILLAPTAKYSLFPHSCKLHSSVSCKIQRRTDWDTKGEINITHFKGFEMYIYPFYLQLTFVCCRISNAVEASDFHQTLEKLGLNSVYKRSEDARTYHETEFPMRMHSLFFDRKFCCK